MRVLYWSEFFWPVIGGLEVLGARLVPALAARGHEVVVVTSHRVAGLPDAEDFHGARIVRVRMRQALETRDLALHLEVRRRIVEVKRALAPDVIHLNLLDASSFFHFQTAHADGGAGVLASVRGDLELGIRQGPGGLLARTLREADRVTVNSRAMLPAAIAAAPGIEPRCSVVYEALEPAAGPPAPPPLDPPVLLAYGRLIHQKGFDLALRALPAIRERFPAARLVVAGDGPARGELEALAADLGLGRAVEFRGWVAPPEVPALLDAATLVIVPSRWDEAFGLVALEAMQRARAVVAARSGGLPEVVPDGEAGLIVERESVEGIARAVIELLADPGRCAALGRAGRASAERFSWKAHVDAVEALYEQCARERAVAARS